MAQVTRAEYQNVKNTVNNQYTADSLQNYQNAYNDYKAQGMSTKDAVAKAQGLLVAKGTTAPSNSGTTTGTTTYSGTTGTTQSTTPTARQTTTVNQTEKPVSTTNEIKQQGQLKPLSQDYYNQTSSEAQDKIRYNLNSYRQSNPELFSTYEDFKKNFSYDARDEVQKQTLDNWYKGYEKGLQLSSVPVNDLYNQYNSGQISSSDLEVLRNYNPTKYTELQNQINKGSIIQAYDDNKDTTGTSIQDMAYESAMQMFKQFMSGDSSSGASQYFQDYKNNLNSPEMLELSDKTTEIDEQRDNILDQISTMTKDVEKEYEGTGATKSKINAIVADRTYDLQQQLRTLDNEYKKYATQYNNRLQQYQNEFQLQLQEYQVNMQARQQQMSELGFAMDLMSFETPEQQQQRQWDYWVAQQEYTNGNINSKDYQTRYKAALSSVQNLLSQYEGIPMIRSAEQMAQDVLKAIDNGSDLGTELTKLNKQIQQKPEYKQLYNATYGTGTTTTGFGKTIKIGDMELIEYNGQWLTADQVKEMFGKGGTGTAKPYDTVDPSKLNNDLRGGTGKNLGKFLLKKLDGMTGGQCGKYVNDYLEYIGMTGATNRYYDNELSTKLNSVNTYDPKEGTVAVFDYNHKSSDGINHGHVGIVTKVTNDGIYVRDSNYSSDEKIKTRFIKKGSAEWENNLKGFFDPSQPPMGSSTEVEGIVTTEPSSDTKVKAEAMLKQIKTGNMTPSETSNARDWLIDNGYGEQFLEALDKGIKVSLTDTQQDFYEYGMNTYKGSDIVKDFKTASSQISNLITSLNAENGAGDLAGIFQFMKVLDPRSVVRKEEFESAAGAAGYANPSALWQNYVKHGWDGTWLTDAARGNFAELAKSIIKSQAEMYEIEYGDLKQVFKNANIDDQWLPTNYAEVILKRLDEMDSGNSSKSTNKSDNTNQTIKSFKNNVTLTFPTLSKLSNTSSVESVLKAKYGLVK